MPLSLGLGAAGKAASAFGGSGKAGPTSTKNVTGGTNTTTSGTSTNANSLNPLMSGFQSSLVPALSSMYAEAQKPVYGTTQIAQVANQGDAATNAASSALASNLAKRGVLNSGAAAAGDTALEAGNVANTVGFENQIPLLNEQAQMANTGNVLNLAEGLTGKALSTGVNTGTTNTVGTNSNTTTESGPAFGSAAASGFGNFLSNTGAAGAGGKTGGGKNGPTLANGGNYGGGPGVAPSYDPNNLS